VALWGIQTGGQGALLVRVSQLCAGVVMLLGLLTFGEYLSGMDFGIDQLLIQDITSLPGDIPGRLAVNTALSFAAVGAALLLLSFGNGWLVAAIHVLTMIPVVAAGSALIGYGYDIDDFLRQQLNYTPMAINSATVFVLLALGVVNARPEYPFRRFMTSDSAAGITVRCLFPAVTGWLIQYGHHTGYFREPMVPALFTATSIAGLSILILWNAEKLYEAGFQRNLSDVSLHEQEEELSAIVKILPVGLWLINAESKLVYHNEAAEQIWAGARHVSLNQLSEYYKGWRVDSGKPIKSQEWASARAFLKGETIMEDDGRDRNLRWHAQVHPRLRRTSPQERREHPRCYHDQL
jgi:PAS domain-containing protein